VFKIYVKILKSHDFGIIISKNKFKKSTLLIFNQLYV